MVNLINRFLDATSEFLAHRKGLLPFLGILLITLNALLQFIPGTGFLVETNLLLHLGAIIAILGLMLAWAL
ncbi:hypothetical protein ACFLY4_06195 [Chloroflexota bacterium]